MSENNHKKSETSAVPLDCLVILKEGLQQLKAEWEAQADFLNNPHDHEVDRAIGKTYQECADILNNRFGI